MGFSEIDGPDLRIYATSGDGESSAGPRSDEPTIAEKILSLLDQIRAMDKTMDEARAAKIVNIRKAILDGRYHLSAAEVARKILDHIDEP
jgi:anti-sigma28 factor (negative regulator of flagellin synthesis)